MSDDLVWGRQYRAALNEADASQRLTRIEEAERVLKQALRQAIENGDSAKARNLRGASSPEPAPERYSAERK